jgi:hypothetical protein
MASLRKHARLVAAKNLDSYKPKVFSQTIAAGHRTLADAPSLNKQKKWARA